MLSVVPEDERPFQSCDAWVSCKVAMCWAPPAAWEMTQAQICSLCELHNRAREVDLPVAKTAQGKPFVEQGAKRCTQCGGETFKGRVLCHRCLFEKRRQREFKERPATAMPPEERTCRFCGQENVYYKQWRHKHQMCHKTACWRAFLEEMKSQKVAI